MPGKAVFINHVVFYNLFSLMDFLDFNEKTGMMVYKISLVGEEEEI